MCPWKPYFFLGRLVVLSLVARALWSSRNKYVPQSDGVSLVKESTTHFGGGAKDETKECKFRIDNALTNRRSRAVYQRPAEFAGKSMYIRRLGASGFRLA